MNTTFRTLFSAVTLTCIASIAHADLLLEYNNFTPSPNTNPVINKGTLGSSGNGTYYNPATVNGIVGPGSYAPHFDDGSGGNANLSTGFSTNNTLGSVSNSGNNFTMSAWVNLDNTNGDNMVFGTNGGSPMHLGFRGDQAYFGFWGNDSGSGNLAGNGVTHGADVTGNWNFFTWTYDSLVTDAIDL